MTEISACQAYRKIQLQEADPNKSSDHAKLTAYWLLGMGKYSYPKKQDLPASCY
jgi:hypothetical protein